MKIVLHRSQKSGLMGKASFFLKVKGQFSQEELSLVKKYNLGGEVLVYHEKAPSSESVVGAVYKIMKDTVLTSSSLINGTKFTCKNVAELLEIEEQVKEASINLRRYLYAASNFDGDEIIDIDKLDAESK